ncbi:MAG: PAS domain-containing sensor histidine kinase [Acidimicrobiales bacterium]
MEGSTASRTIAALERRSVVDALDAMVPITVLDEDGRIVYANACWCEMSGIPLDEVVGFHWTALVHPDDLAAAGTHARSALEQGGILTEELRVISPDGRRQTWLRVRVSALAEAGRPCWLVVATDVTDHRRAEEELRQAERRLDAILRHSPDVVTVVEPGGTVRSTTARLEHLGIEQPRVIGDLLAVVHPEDRGRAARSFFSLLHRGEELYGKLYEIRLCMPDGSVRWIETTGINLVDEPSVGGVVFISRDVTARHEVEGQLLAVSSRLAALVEHMHLGVHLSDEQGRVLAVNPAFLATVGIEGAPDDFLGRPAADDVSPFAARLADPERDLSRCARMVADRLLVAEERFALSNGRTVAADFVPTEVAGEPRGHLWLVRDVTGEMAVATEREHMLELERRQNARLSELDAMRSHLVSSVSHELRTPLTSITSFSQLLRSGLGTDSVAVQVEYLEVVDRNTDRLLRLVNELLLLDRLESDAGQTTAGQTAAGKVDVGEVVRQAVSSIRPTADAKHVAVTLRSDAGPAILGDADRVGQLVDNLLSNAVKFTPAGGRVDVAVCQSDLGWRLEVADTGIGIPVADQQHLFERFFRATNARLQAAAGSGLGLAIVRLVAERHGGHVEIRSEEGAGTVVTVTLRGLVDEVAAGPESQEAAGPGTKDGGMPT